MDDDLYLDGPLTLKDGLIVLALLACVFAPPIGLIGATIWWLV